MSDLHDNGYIIQRESLLSYRGIDGDNWYFNYCSDIPYFENYFDENIDTFGEDINRVACCTDVDYLQRYIKESNKNAISFRILRCSSNRNKPILKEKFIEGREVILGYDIAYSGGSYYSCVLNDIVSGRIEAFCKIRLNDNGLFNTYKEAEAFFKYRMELAKKSTEYVFEEGDYVIYMITEIYL